MRAGRSPAERRDFSAQAGEGFEAVPLLGADLPAEGDEVLWRCSDGLGRSSRIVRALFVRATARRLILREQSRGFEREVAVSRAHVYLIRRQEA